MSEEATISLPRANKTLRFINFIVDIAVIIILNGFFLYLIKYVWTITEYKMLSFLPYGSAFFIYYAYFTISELNFQKTIGKVITKTHVVKLNGEKPENVDIVARTFSRLIPLEYLSFIFVENGLHDYISKTTVVKDQSN